MQISNINYREWQTTQNILSFLEYRISKNKICTTCKFSQNDIFLDHDQKCHFCLVTNKMIIYLYCFKDFDFTANCSGAPNYTTVVRFNFLN